jgi:hypothetical protein
MDDWWFGFGDGRRGVLRRLWHENQDAESVPYDRRRKPVAKDNQKRDPGHM